MNRITVSGSLVRASIAIDRTKHICNYSLMCFEVPRFLCFRAKEVVSLFVGRPFQAVFTAKKRPISTP